MKGPRGLEDIKTRKNVKIPSAMPDSATSQYLELFLLEKEQQKLNKEMEILGNQMELLNRRKKEKQAHLDEIHEQIAEALKSESTRLEITFDDMPQRARGVAGRSRLAHGRSEGTEKESGDSEKRWQTIKLDY